MVMYDFALYFQSLSLAALYNIAIMLVASIVFAIIAVVFGCLFAGIDRKLSARMQGRIGPSILQPYYDVRKLFGKKKTSLNGPEGVYIFFALLFVFLAGGIYISGFYYGFQENFWEGGNFLLSVFVVTLSTLLFIMAAYSSRSPYAEIGASREILQVLSYEPTLMLFAVGLFFMTGSFSVQSVILLDQPLICQLWPMFICFVFILIIKFRKSPFDISMSHHAHQEIVRGMTTEMSGPTLAKVEIMHWCENVLFVFWISVFFIYSNPISFAIAALACLVVYFLMIWIDNNFARVKWQAMLKWSWLLALIGCGLNLVFLLFLM